MKPMTGKERMLTALSDGVPDRVPVAPDFSCMIPCRLTGKPFWEVLLYERPPLWKAYLDACDRFGTEAWAIYGDLQPKGKSPVSWESRITSVDDRLQRQNICHTQDGDLTWTERFFQGDASTWTEKIIKNLKADMPKLRRLYSEIDSYSLSQIKELGEAVGDRGIWGVSIATPGLQYWMNYFEGGLEAATYAMIDEPELFDELCSLLERQQEQLTEICCREKVESILTGGSGSITLQSPAIWQERCLPAIKKQTRMCRQAGVLSGIHSCGKEKYIVETCAKETDLDYINPLEIPPMGDCHLAECKELAGGKLALMGNLHTTNVMLFGDTDTVRLEALRALRDAGEGGGFVLSTGDQCGRDTPDENILELVRVAEEFGYYPLNMEKICCEIERLEKKRRHG